MKFGWWKVDTLRCAWHVLATDKRTDGQTDVHRRHVKPHSTNIVTTDDGRRLDGAGYWTRRKVGMWVRRLGRGCHWTTQLKLDSSRHSLMTSPTKSPPTKHRLTPSDSLLTRWTTSLSSIMKTSRLPIASRNCRLKIYTVSTKKLQPCIRCHNSSEQRRFLTKFYANTETLNCKQVTKFLQNRSTSACNSYNKFSKATQKHKCPL